MTVWVGRETYCDYATIGAAVEALESRSDQRPETLCLLPGIYREQIRIDRSRLSIVGIGQVEIAAGRYAREIGADGQEIGTFATPTLFLGGSDLRIENLTVSNTAGQGARIGQAVALAAHCDRAVFRSCTFRGHQDTLFTGPFPPSPRRGSAFRGMPIRREHTAYRQLYQNCRIEGTVDYIFGGATAFFERCELRSLAREAGAAGGYITAASTPEGQAFGYVFRDCLLTAERGVEPGSVYLGRPWRSHAKTVFAGCRAGAHIHPAGWHNWDEPANERTADYREYREEAELLSAVRAPWAICRSNQEEAWSKASVFGKDRFWEEQ